VVDGKTMTVRGADYPRRPGDDYPTPPEAAEVIFHLVKFSELVFDPCCGRGRSILKVARRHGYSVKGRDIVDGHDFLDHVRCPDADVVTNPPYGGRRGTLALKFIERALELTRGEYKVAMLLPVDFDSARTRRHVFGDHPAFALKVVLLDRIKWFDGQSGSTNHAWYVWDWRHRGDPIIKYARIAETKDD
jgi:hypothetical protein